MSRRFFFLTVALSLALTAAVYTTPDARAAQARGSALPRVVYGFDREFPPFSFEDPGGKAVGFEVELLEAIFSGSANLVTRPLQWSIVPVELSAGSIQVTSGMVRTTEREKMYLFPERATFPLHIAMFTKIYSRFPNITLLRGQKVSTEQGSYAHRLLERFGGINIKPFTDKTSPIKALFNDEVNAYCGPASSAYYYINKLGYSGITTMGTPLGITRLRYAVNRDRGDILRLLNTGFAKVMENGEYDRIYKKWFVRDLTQAEAKALVSAAQNGVQAAYVPYSMKPAGGAVLAATGKIYYGSLVENAETKVAISGIEAAVASAVTAGDIELRAAVSINASGNPLPLSPKEMQLLSEFGRGILVLGANPQGSYTAKMVGELLPRPVTARPAITVQ